MTQSIIGGELSVRFVLAPLPRNRIVRYFKKRITEDLLRRPILRIGKKVTFPVTIQVLRHGDKIEILLASDTVPGVLDKVLLASPWSWSLGKEECVQISTRKLATSSDAGNELLEKILEPGLLVCKQC